ncbi:MAG: hypothetical protein KF774_06040 [Planctomyces sp.]|nr:hypothetical protein [Planctomyces sp.]
MTPEPLDAIPLWGLLAGTATLVFLLIEAGYRLGRRRRQQTDVEREPPVGATVAALLALLGFLLAFTFGMAASRFDARRLALLEEANAISTTWLRAELLPPALRDEVRSELEEYVDVRLAGATLDGLRAAIVRSEELHRALWARAVAAAEQAPTPITGLFVQSLNQMIDMHATRLLLALGSRIPIAIWIGLYFVAALAMGVLGYLEGLTSPRRTPATIALVLTFSSVICLIADLDRPGEGVLRVSQQAMQDLRQFMQSPSSLSQGAQP